MDKKYCKINNKKYLTPAIISNSIVDIENSQSIDWNNLIYQIRKIDCKNIQFRFYKNIDINMIKMILELFNSSRINSIDFVLNAGNIKIQTIYSLIDIYPRIGSIYLFVDNEDTYSSKQNGIMGNVFIIKGKFYSQDNCGVITQKNFIINSQTHTESFCHNTCLNRKISIDVNGNIKNCPSMEHSYGNIKDTDLIEVVRKPEFRKWWYYKKDDIDVCQDCEFRHICTDCRAFIKNPDNILSQPAKCGYNPYIALWEGQENWISVEKWRKENPNWEEQAKENRASYQKENCEINLKEEKEYFNNL